MLYSPDVPVHVEDGSEVETVTVMPLGAGQEVGRSCITLRCVIGWSH